MYRLVHPPSILSLLVFIFGYVDDGIAQTSSLQRAEIENQTASEAIQLFDDLCIRHAYEDTHFHLKIKELAQRMLAPNEYTTFWPERSQSEEFYDISVSNGAEHLIVGHVSNGAGNRNCIVGLKIEREIAYGFWAKLYYDDYATNKLKVDDNGPSYFVERELDSPILVQIGAQNGFVSYYSYFK